MDELAAAEFLLNTRFHDEDADEEALRALVLQLGVYREQATVFRALVHKIIAAQDGSLALKLVEDFANRDVLGSEGLALTWLGSLEMDIESVQGAVPARIGGRSASTTSAACAAEGAHRCLPPPSARGDRG